MLRRAGPTPTGWAWRIADALTSSYNPGGTVPMITSVAGDTLFCNGAASTRVGKPGEFEWLVLQRRNDRARNASATLCR
jgi:hypothetical protein